MIEPVRMIARWIDRRRDHRCAGYAETSIGHIASMVSDHAWAEYVEYADNVSPVDELVVGNYGINLGVLPTPVRQYLRARCSHQVRYLVSRYLQIGAVDPVVPACDCRPAARAWLRNATPRAFCAARLRRHGRRTSTANTAARANRHARARVGTRSGTAR